MPTLKTTKLQKVREERLLSKAELANLAGISPQTLARIEKGANCRIDIKRKIVEALGYSPEDGFKIFN